RAKRGFAAMVPRRGSSRVYLTQTSPLSSRRRPGSSLRGSRKVTEVESGQDGPGLRRGDLGGTDDVVDRGGPAGQPLARDNLAHLGLHHVEHVVDRGDGGIRVAGGDRVRDGAVRRERGEAEGG